MPKPAAAEKAPTPSPTPETFALAREIHAFFNALSMREDVVFARKNIRWGLEGTNIKAVAKAGMPPELVAFAATISEAECVWDFIDDKDGGMDGAAGGRFVLPRYSAARWSKPDGSYAFPKGSRFVLIDTHVNEGYGYAFEPAPGQPVEYVFARAGEEGQPFPIASTLEGYLRKGLATGFAWYWQVESKESKHVAKRLAEKAALRKTVNVSVRSARVVDRRTLRSTMLKDLVSPVWAKSLVKMLGATVPRGGKEAELYATLAEAIDAVPSRSDDDVRSFYEIDRRSLSELLHRALPTAANIRRALDVFTLGSSQPDELVELDIELDALVPAPDLLLANRGFFAQVLAGRSGSTIRERLGETEFWDTTSDYGQGSLGHAHIVPILELPFPPKILGTPVKFFANASDVPGIAAGETWKATALIAPMP